MGEERIAVPKSMFQISPPIPNPPSLVPSVSSPAGSFPDTPRAPLGSQAPGDPERTQADRHQEFSFKLVCVFGYFHNLVYEYVLLFYVWKGH